MEEIFYGIDVSKGYADIVRMGKDSYVSKHLKLNDTKDGIKELMELVEKDTDEGRYVYMGVESTGGYENNWYNNFYDLGKKSVIMLRINPIRIHHETKKDMQRNITDKVSGKAIANHLRENKDKLINTPVKTKEETDLTRLLTSHQMFIKQRTQAYTALEKVVYDTMPGLLTFWNDKCPKYLLALLLKFPSKAKLLKTQPSSISKIKGISFDKATKIIEMVKNDSALKEDNKIKSFQIKALVNTILNLDGTITAIEKEFQSSEKYKQKIGLLSSIPGCGESSAAILNIEIGDINRFSSAAQMCAYFGTHPEKKQSGDGTTKARMSKTGSPKFRAALYMVAKNAAMYSDYFKEIYVKNRAKGKVYDSALGVVMNKLVRVIYGILKSGIPFDPSIAKSEKDSENQKIGENTKLEKETENLENAIVILEKELENSKKAPTSALKKSRIKKAIEESQNALDALKTRSSSLPVTNI
jgi:transposase